VARSSTKKPGVEPGFPFLSGRRAVLEAEETAELPVQASPDHREVVAVAAVVEANPGKLVDEHSVIHPGDQLKIPNA